MLLVILFVRNTNTNKGHNLTDLCGDPAISDTDEQSDHVSSDGECSDDIVLSKINQFIKDQT